MSHCDAAAASFVSTGECSSNCAVNVMMNKLCMNLVDTIATISSCFFRDFYGRPGGPNLVM